MRSFLKYGILFVVIIITIFLYGFIVGGQPPIVLLLIVFAISFSMLAIFERNHIEKSIAKKTGKIIVVSIVAVALSAYLYYGINGLKGTLIDTYDTTVTEVIYMRDGSVTVYFLDPTGEEKCAEHFSFDNLKLVVGNDEEIKQGDNVKIAEYNGLFDIEYCVLLKNI